MNLQKYFARAERLDGLIRRQSTGTPGELAFQLNLSERSVYELIDQMKTWAPPLSTAT